MCVVVCCADSCHPSCPAEWGLPQQDPSGRDDPGSGGEAALSVSGCRGQSLARDLGRFQPDQRGFRPDQQVRGNTEIG